jgi:AraC-like DNA-binding protein
MHIPLLSLTALFGATQGLLLAIILLFLPKRPLTNKLLAAFLLAESIRLFMLMFTYDHWLLRSVWWYLLLNVNFLIGPLLYSYVRAMTDPAFQPGKHHALHLLPLLLVSIICLFIFYDADQHLVNDLNPKLFNTYWWGIVLSIFSFASLLIYAYNSLQLLPAYSKLIRQQFSSIEKINLKWLKWLVCFCLATAAVSMAVELTRLGTDINVGPRIMLSLLMSVAMIYGIGIMGIRQPGILGQGDWQLIDSKLNDEESKPVPQKYKKSGLSEEHSQILWEKLLDYMDQQQPYLENGLKLSDLSEMMDVLPNHLSQIINSHAGKSFFDFINHYRVETAKTLLKESLKKPESIANIAMEAGFNSQNTFYNQFKKHTGTTPSKYKKSAA